MRLGTCTSFTPVSPEKQRLEPPLPPPRLTPPLDKDKSVRMREGTLLLAAFFRSNDKANVFLFSDSFPNFPLIAPALSLQVSPQNGGGSAFPLRLPSR